MKTSLLVSVLTVTLATASYADNLEWNAPVNGNIDDASQWTPNSEPASDDRLFFSVSGDYTLGSTRDVSVTNVTLGGNSGVIRFELGNHHLQTSLIIANQDATWASGQLTTNLQIGNATSGLGFLFDGANSRFTGSAVSIGRSSGTAGANENSLSVTNGANFATSSAVIVGNNDANTAHTANANTLSISGTGTTFAAGGGIIVGNLGSTLTGAAASGNRLVIEDGAQVTTASLVLGRRASGTLATAINNSVRVTGTSTAGTLLSVNGNISIGPVGGGNSLYVGKYATVEAKSGNTSLNARAGNKLEVDGGVFDASGRKIIGYALSTISMSDSGTLKAEELDIRGGTFTTQGQNSIDLEQLTLNDKATLQLSIGNGGIYSTVNVSETATLDGVLRVVFSESFAPTGGESFQLFGFNEVNGAFAELALPELAINLQWDTSKLYQTGTISVIPEPASTGLAVSGILMALVGYRFTRTSAR